MGTKKPKRQVYREEFKLDAVRLIVDERRGVADVGRSLGVSQSMLHRWRKAYLGNANTAFPGRGRQLGVEAEITHLKRDLARARQERDILKTALAYFAKDSK